MLSPARFTEQALLPSRAPAPSSPAQSPGRAPSSVAHSLASSPSADSLSLEVRPEAAEAPPAADHVDDAFAAKQRAATLRTLGLGAVGGLVLAARTYGKEGLLGGQALLDAAQRLGDFGIVISPKVADVVSTVAQAVLPAAITQAGAIGSFRFAAMVGVFLGVPANQRAYFAQWTPGTRWPEECASMQPPAPPPPPGCPSEMLASVQGLSMPVFDALTPLYLSMAAAAGMSAVAYFTPVGRRLARLPGLDSTYALAAAALVGVLPLAAWREAHSLFAG